MTSDAVFRLILLVCYVSGWIIRAYILRKAQFGKSVKSVNQKREMLMFRLGTALHVVPLVYALTSWLDFADFPLPVWLRGIGAVVMVLATGLMLLSHLMLGGNWSGQLNIQDTQRLMVRGIYAHLRHPMYLAFLLSGVGTLLLSANWVIGVPLIVWFWVMYLGRIDNEEQMMLNAFGDDYRVYMQATGRLLPRLSAYKPTAVANP